MGPSIDIPYVRWTFHELPSTLPCIRGTIRQLSVHQETFHEHSVRPRNLPSTFINIPYICGAFCKLSIQLQGHPPTYINFPFIRGNFRLLSVHLWEIPSNSLHLLCVEVHGKSSSSAESLMMFSINFLHCCWTFCELPSTCCASAGHSVNFSCIHRTLYHLSVHLRNIPESFMQLPDLPSTSVNFLCICGTFHLLSVHLQIFYQIPSAFCVSVGSSKKFCTAIGYSVNTSQLSVRLRDFPSAFCASTRHSVNFCQLSIRPRGYPLTFCVSAEHSVNFSELPCGRGTFCQLSVHLQDLPSTFCVSAEISVHFCQLSVRSWDLPSTSVNNHVSSGPSVNILCIRGTFKNVSYGGWTFCQL